MRIPGRVRFAAVIGIAAVVVAGLAGCESSEGLPVLTHPHEVVTAAAASTAALGTVHVQIDLAGRNEDGAGGEQIRYAVQADIDVQGRNVAGRSQKTRSLAAVSGNFSVGGAVILLSVTFSNHDLPIRIAAPPPQLVDNPNGGFRIDPPRAVPVESPAP